MSKVCRKHILKPVIIYGQCIGCELEMYQTRIKELEDEIKELKVRTCPELTKQPVAAD